jgi:hypothetical protein
MKFRDRKHQLSVQDAEHHDPTAQAIIKEFCELINFPYQLQQGLFAIGFYSSVFPVSSPQLATEESDDAPAAEMSDLGTDEQSEGQHEQPQSTDVADPELLSADAEGAEESSDDNIATGLDATIPQVGPGEGELTGLENADEIAEALGLATDDEEGGESR